MGREWIRRGTGVEFVENRLRDPGGRRDDGTRGTAEHPGVGAAACAVRPKIAFLIILD